MKLFKKNNKCVPITFFQDTNKYKTRPGLTSKRKEPI